MGDNKPRILITGGAGFIGKRLVRRWRALGADVVVVDWLKSTWDLPAPDSLLDWVKGDIRDDGVLQRAFSLRPDIVYHLAAIHHIPTCERERSLTLSVNVVGTEMVLDYAGRAGVSAVILASSGAVYRPCEEMLTEDSAVEGVDNYAISKMANERQLDFWQQRSGAAAIVARIFNTIAHDDPNGHLIPDVLAQLDAPDYTGVIRLGNLEPRRDYIHADDTAGALYSLGLRQAGIAGLQICNISSGTETSVGDLVRLLAAARSQDVRVEVDPTRKRRVDRISQLGSNQRLFELTGFRPHFSLRDSLQAIANARPTRNS